MRNTNENYNRYMFYTNSYDIDDVNSICLPREASTTLTSAFV